MQPGDIVHKGQPLTEGAADPQAGSPYGINVDAGWRNDVTGVPCTRPPYGGIRAIDLTPAAIGPAVIPPVNGETHVDAMNVNMITCGGQATIPMVAAVSRGVDIAEYTPGQVKQAVTGHGRAEKAQEPEGERPDRCAGRNAPSFMRPP